MPATTQLQYCKIWYQLPQGLRHTYQQLVHSSTQLQYCETRHTQPTSYSGTHQTRCSISAVGTYACMHTRGTWQYTPCGVYMPHIMHGTVVLQHIRVQGGTHLWRTHTSYHTCAWYRTLHMLLAVCGPPGSHPRKKKSVHMLLGTEVSGEEAAPGQRQHRPPAPPCPARQARPHSTQCRLTSQQSPPLLQQIVSHPTSSAALC